MLQPQDETLPAQPGGCSKCHVTLGPKPNQVGEQTEADYANVDCLLCHGPDYSRTVAKEGDALKWVPAEGVDVLAVAQNVQRPTNQMCLRCHTGTGGGPNAKHGVIPTMDTDVHMAAGLQCVDCHTSQEHKIAGAADIKAQDLPDVEVKCTNCHTDGHQAEGEIEGLPLAETLNAHTDYVACQSCHIPAIARDPNMPTLLYRDYANPVLNEKTGLYGPAGVWEGNVMPEYHWWNRMMQSPPEPVGSRGDGLLMPWKRSTYNIAVDAATGDPIYLKLGAYFITGKLEAGVAKGVEARQAIDPDYTYSGEFTTEEETMVFSVNHQVAPASEALACTECHSAEGRLDWAALGYTEEEIAVLSSFPPTE